VEGGFFLDVVIRELNDATAVNTCPSNHSGGSLSGDTDSSAVFKLLSGEYEALLIRRDTLFLLNLVLHIVDGIG